MASKLKAAVAGANGYAGMTAVNLLAQHPGVELAQLTSRSYAGKPYAEVYPLLGLSGEFLAEPAAGEVDVVFSCLPHNVGAGKAAAWLEAGARVIDMSADFRLHDSALYPTWYRQPHPQPDLLAKAVLGLPELHESELKDAALVAVPGCYSTAAILALAPAVSAGLVGSDIVVDAKSGVSGSGRSPGIGVHFSEVNESLSAYAIEGHRHLPEVIQELSALTSPLAGEVGAQRRVGSAAPAITFVPHLVPMTRGILATCYFDLKGSLDELKDAYREFYSGQPFTKVVDKTPATKQTSHSNLCLVNVAAQGRKAVITSALDNLIKGASGQGVECFNIAFGFERTTALDGPMQWP
ncbi:MAG: N-acetyl-gamma-glutamyl-phosphate reductase [Chloroflexi bacterium]|nr:MAG: N-acetyl-gamma-glutamyl-phosphate reductase [Chloroflexota bacterium]